MSKAGESKDEFHNNAKLIYILLQWLYLLIFYILENPYGGGRWE